LFFSASLNWWDYWLKQVEKLKRFLPLKGMGFSPYVPASKEEGP
jgi:hypothetical protein